MAYTENYCERPGCPCGGPPSQYRDRRRGWNDRRKRTARRAKLRMSDGPDINMYLDGVEWRQARRMTHYDRRFPHYRTP